MAATFLKARGYAVGRSLIEDDRLETAANLMQKACDGGVRLLLPVDVIVADDIDAAAGVVTVQVENIGKTQQIADIGPQTTKAFYEELRRCHTIFWNGPMGVYEIPRFAEGTRAMAKLLAGSQATTILGGGSTAEVAINMGLSDRMTFISTGGGASLRFLGSEPLPGVEALHDRTENHV